MSHKTLVYVALVIASFALASLSVLHAEDIRKLLTYGLGDRPTHEPYKGCHWVKENFSMIHLFGQVCADASMQSPLSESTDGTTLQTQTTKYGYSFKLHLFSKEVSQGPLDVVKGWYAKLTPNEQKVCEIQNADEPLQYFNDGKPNWTEGPHPTAHKTRYEIAVKPEIVQQISDKYGGDPGSGSGYDYICGRTVGTTWSGHPPYFEFDDRSPDKYLMVGTYGQEGPMIDLNSIRF